MEPTTFADPELTALLERMRILGEETSARLAKRPCNGLDGEPAIAACLAAKAQGSCDYSQQPDVCPLRRQLLDYRATIERIDAGRVDPVHAVELQRWFARSADRVTPRPTDALRLVQAFLARRPATVMLRQTIDAEIPIHGDEWCLILSGGVGVGKTIASAWAIARYGGMVLRAPECARLDDQVDERGDLVGVVMSRARSTSLLVLDDLGTEHEGQTKWATGRIGELLIARHSKQLLTICTTNLDRRGVGSISERYGARLDDRLRQGGLFVGIGGPSLRGVS